MVTEHSSLTELSALPIQRATVLFIMGCSLKAQTHFDTGSPHESQFNHHGWFLMVMSWRWGDVIIPVRQIFFF